MNTSAHPARLVNSLLIATMASIVVSAATTSNAQSVKLDFRFDGTGSNTMLLAPGSQGQTFTVDVYVTLFGDATHTDPSTWGLQGVHLRGFSDTSGGSAFATGPGIGVTSTAPFPVAPGSGFVQSDVTGPNSIADSGSTTNGIGSPASTPDGITDFGGRNNTLLDLVISHQGYVFASSFGAAGSGANAGGWTFEVAQFDFTTGQAGSVAGATTMFWPTQTQSGTAANITLDGGNTVTTIPHTNELIGTPLIFSVTVVPEPSTIALAGLGFVGLVALCRRSNR